MTVIELIQKLLDGIKTGQIQGSTPVLVPCVWTSLNEDPRFTYRALTDEEFQDLEDPYKPAELEVHRECFVAPDLTYKTTGTDIYRPVSDADPGATPAVILY